MHSYIHPLAGAFPSFVYKQNCNATRKPLNDIPTKRYNESCTFSIFRDCSTAGDTSLLYLYNVSFPKVELILLIHISISSRHPKLFSKHKQKTSITCTLVYIIATQTSSSLARACGNRTHPGRS